MWDHLSNLKKPVETKIYSFKTDKSQRLDVLMKTSEYMNKKLQMNLEILEPEPYVDPQGDKSIENIMSFLNIGK